jgi:oxygen-independent coproporphyrinogen-3 oxidase
MWQGTDCYAFGVSAFSGLGAWSFQNTNDLDKYMATVEAGELPISRGHHLSSLDQLIRTVLLEMKLTRLNLQTFQNRYGFRLETLCATPLAELETAGLLTRTDPEIRLTPAGVLQGDYVGKYLANHLLTFYA